MRQTEYPLKFFRLLHVSTLPKSTGPVVKLLLNIPVKIYTVFQKTCDHVFDDKLKFNCPFTKIFGTLIDKSIGHRQVFLFSHLTYLVQLLYLGKLSRPIYQQKLNEIMKISQEDVILIKKPLSVKAVWCTKAVE